MPIPQIGNQPDVMVGTMYINFKNFGWSERYYINTPVGSGDIVPSYVAAASTLLAGCGYRRMLLGLNASIVWARVSLLNLKRESYRALTTPLASSLVDAEVATEKINEVGDGLLFRFDDGQGRFALRHIRGVRDSWVTDEDVVAALTDGLPTPDTATVVPVDPAIVTKKEALNNFLVWVMRNTVMIKKNVAVPGSYISYGNATVSFRKVGSRDTGAPFGTSRGRAPSRV